MAESNIDPAKVAELEGRLRAMESAVSEAKGAISLAKWFVALSFGAIIMSIYSCNEVRTTSAVHAEKISALEKSIERLIDVKKTSMYGAIVKHGKIVSNEKGKLTVEGEDGKQWACNLTPTTEVRIDLKPAKADDLKPEMLVEALVDKNSDCIWIDATSAASGQLPIRRRIIVNPKKD